MNAAFAKKAAAAAVAGLVVVGIVAFLRSIPPPAPASVIVPGLGPEGSVLEATTDPQIVYQKAFWRRPAPDDKILHAERREWTAPGDVVRKWQWFIAFQPGPQTREWIASNPFGLIAAVSGFSLTGLEDRPAWFPITTANYGIQQNRQGHLIWIHSRDRTVLYATDSGFGFAAAVAKP